MIWSELLYIVLLLLLLSVLCLISLFTMQC